MRIEAWNSVHENYNPAWRAAENLRKWCVAVDLHPNTVKPFSDLSEIIERTALGKVTPRNAVDGSYLTPKELDWTKGNSPEISQMKKLAIVDIDGVLVSVWPTLGELWQNRKFSSQAIRETVEKNRPPWTTLLPLGDIARKVDRLIIWTSRFSPEKIPLLFSNLGSIDAFPYLSQPKIEKIEERFFPGKTQVIAGEIKGLRNSGFDQVTKVIEELGDPYIVYAGSSLFDIHRFKSLINYLRKRELPFDQFVFCTSGHLVF